MATYWTSAGVDRRRGILSASTSSDVPRRRRCDGEPVPSLLAARRRAGWAGHSSSSSYGRGGGRQLGFRCATGCSSTRPGARSQTASPYAGTHVPAPDPRLVGSAKRPGWRRGLAGGRADRPRTRTLGDDLRTGRAHRQAQPASVPGVDASGVHCRLGTSPRQYRRRSADGSAEPSAAGVTLPNGGVQYASFWLEAFTKLDATLTILRPCRDR